MEIIFITFTLKKMEEEGENYNQSNREYNIRKSIINQLIAQKKSIFEILKLKEKDLKVFSKVSEGIQLIYSIYKSNIKSSDIDNYVKKQYIDINELIKKLKIPSEKRTIDDIYIIRKYIKKTNIKSLFFNEINFKEKLYNNVLLFICLFLKFKYIKKDTTIFRMGEQPDFLYLILEGKIEILKPLPKIKSLTGNEYFLQLMKYRRNNDKFLYSLCVQENNINYEIQKKDKDLIPYIYLLYRLKDIRKRIFIDFKLVFELICISPADLGLDPEKVHSIGYMYKKTKYIRAQMPTITEEELKLYKFIDEKEIKKTVTIFEYVSFLKLDKNKYFGENAIYGKIVRNATIKTEENCYLGYLDINLYHINFYPEKKAIFDKKINFLHSNFFFQKISQRKFERRYFNSFISENYINNDYIYNENSPSNYIYFIEEGTVELTSTKSILEIQLLLKGLGEMDSKIKSKYDYDKINSNWSEIENQVMKKQMNKLLVLGKKNILGLESFYYRIPYITNARVISPTAKIIKIDKEHLFQILIKSSESLHDFEAKVDNNIKIISKRLFGINNMKLKRIDSKIILDQKMELEQIENKNKNKTQSKLTANNSFLHRRIKIKKTFNPILINTSAELRNLSSFLKEENKKNKKIDFSLILNDDSKSLGKYITSSASPKNRMYSYYNKGKIVSSVYEKQLLKKIKKEMISLRKGKFKYYSLLKSENTNCTEKESKEEKTSQMNYNNFNNEIIKLSTLLKKYDRNLPFTNEEIINKSSNENSFEFVTKVSDSKPNLFEENKKQSRNYKLPKIRDNSIIGKNSFLSIISKNDTSIKNKSKSTRDLNINFSYNNRIIKNYSFINKYIYKENNQIIDKIDPKEKYKIFDNYSKRIRLLTKNVNKISLTEMKKYVPKTIRSKDFVLKIKKYQEYRKKIQRKIEEMTS